MSRGADAQHPVQLAGGQVPDREPVLVDRLRKIFHAYGIHAACAAEARTGVHVPVEQIPVERGGHDDDAAAMSVAA